jgi:hypothetical protein
MRGLAQMRQAGGGQQHLAGYRGGGKPTRVAFGDVCRGDVEMLGAVAALGV